jgi:hypothetical protein
VTTSQETRFYVHRGEQYLTTDRQAWTDSLDNAWHTTDRTDAGTVAREHNAKALPVKVTGMSATSVEASEAPPSEDPREVLKWVYQRSKWGCFSRKRSERDRALSDINRYTEKFQ